jgi:Predicted Fe-S oxidoreductase
MELKTQSSSRDLNPVRYSVIAEKNPREIVLLRGKGCSWRRCRFCDYHLDFNTSDAENFALNSRVLNAVTGLHRRLEIINSGSFTELDDATLERVISVCETRGISQAHFECHWLQRDAIPAARARFAAHGIALKIKIGVESFDALFRESYLDKGFSHSPTPAEIAAMFDECCLLQGLPGQTAQRMIADIETGLAHFERVCVNIMQENSAPVKPDPRVIAVFASEIYPRYIRDERVDILMANTDFGVGEKIGGNENVE